MNAVFTNTTSEAVALPGPNVQVEALSTFTWEDVLRNDIQGNSGIMALVEDGTLTVSYGYTVAELALLTGFEGQLEYATDGRKTSEGAGVGTGVPVYFSNTLWRRYFDDAQVTA